MILHFLGVILSLMTSTVKNPGRTFESLMLLETSFCFLNERGKLQWCHFQKATGKGQTWEDLAFLGELGATGQASYQPEKWGNAFGQNSGK